MSRRAQTYDLDTDLISEIKALSAENRVKVSCVVNAMLRFSMGEVSAGRQRIERKPIGYTVQLFGKDQLSS